MATKVLSGPRSGDHAALAWALRAWRGRVGGSAGVLWRHWLPILGCLMVVLGLTGAYIAGRTTGAYIAGRTPLYRATALLALDQGSSGQGAAAQDVNPRDQLRSIESRVMAERLVERLDLHLIPEFQPDMTSGAGRTDPWLRPPILERLPKPLAEALGAGPDEGTTDDQRAARLRDGAIEAAMSRTPAEVVRPRVLRVEFMSADLQLAAAGANALAALHLEEQRARRRDASKRDRALLAAEIERLRASIRETEQAFEAARASTHGGIAPPSGQTLPSGERDHPLARDGARSRDQGPRGADESRFRNSTGLDEAAARLADGLRATREEAILQQQERVFAVDVDKRAFASSAAESVPLDPALDISLLTAKSELIGESTGGIRFFPDGSSTGGRIELELLGERAAVNVRWSTGAVTLER